MRKGERVFLTEDYINAIYWEDLGNGFSLIAKPNFKSLSVATTEQIITSDKDDYEQEDINYCMENLSHKQMTVEDFLHEVNDKKLAVKKMMLEILKCDTEIFSFDEVCNATEILTSSERNIELLQLYLYLSKLKNFSFDKDVIGVIREEDIAEKKIKYIIMNKDIEKNVYERDYYVGCIE